MKLTNDTYFSPEANLEYMSASQFKAFHACEAAALAQLRGEWTREASTALLVGSYVDAYFEGILEQFKSSHPEILLKSGGLKAEYRQADEIIARIERDEKMMKYLSGERQVIMVGEIAGVPFKIKVDALHREKAIVDLKIMRDFEGIWDSAERRKLAWWEAWGYDFQGAIYREIERQNRSESAASLPFYLVAATKEREPDIEIGEIAPERLDAMLTVAKELAPRYAAIKRGEIEPERCGHCDYCKHTKIISEIAIYGAAD